MDRQPHHQLLHPPLTPPSSAGVDKLPLPLPPPSLPPALPLFYTPPSNPGQMAPIALLQSRGRTRFVSNELNAASRAQSANSEGFTTNAQGKLYSKKWYAILDGPKPGVVRSSWAEVEPFIRRYKCFHFSHFTREKADDCVRRYGVKQAKKRQGRLSTRHSAPYRQTAAPQQALPVQQLAAVPQTATAENTAAVQQTPAVKLAALEQRTAALQQEGVASKSSQSQTQLQAPPSRYSWIPAEQQALLSGSSQLSTQQPGDSSSSYQLIVPGMMWYGIVGGDLPGVHYAHIRDIAPMLESGATHVTASSWEHALSWFEEHAGQVKGKRKWYGVLGGLVPGVHYAVYDDLKPTVERRQNRQRIFQSAPTALTWFVNHKQGYKSTQRPEPAPRTVPAMGTQNDPVEIEDNSPPPPPKRQRLEQDADPTMHRGIETVALAPIPSSSNAVPQASLPSNRSLSQPDLESARSSCDIVPISEPKLSKEQADLVDLIMTGKNVFYTGSAGVGKSTVLNAFKREFSKRGISISVVAPTGKAALAIGGTTTWSFAGWTPDSHKKPLEQLITEAHGHVAWKRLDAVKVLVIDEISMVENLHFERINELMKEIKKSGLAFGGVQIIVTGDVSLSSVPSHQLLTYL